MRRLLACLFFPLVALADSWSLEKLYTRPFVWGTSPTEVTWSKQGHVLVFLWNAEGNRFLDLYAYHPAEQKLVRLTDMQPVHDDLNLSDAEKDERRKNYLMPPEGIAAFQMSRDGGRASFAYQGDIYIVSTGNRAAPFRLTKTKAAESAPQLSPDGSQIAYQRDGQLFVQDLIDGRLWQVTDIEEKNQSLGASGWSPDSKRFFYTVRTGLVRQLVLPNYAGRLVMGRSFDRSLAGDEAPESRIYVVAAVGGKAVEMQAGPWGAKAYSQTPEWSPDSKSLLRHVVHPDLKRQQLLALDAASGKARVVFEHADPAWANSISFGWSPDARFVFYTSDQDGWEHLYKVPSEGGTAEQLDMIRRGWATTFTFHPRRRVHRSASSIASVPTDRVRNASPNAQGSTSALYRRTASTLPCLRPTWTIPSIYT